MTARSAVFSASRRIGFVGFPISISLIVCHWVPLGVYIRSDFLLGGFGGWVNWLVVVQTWWNAELLINVRQNRN